MTIEIPTDEDPTPFQQFRKPPSVTKAAYGRDAPLLPHNQDDIGSDLRRHPTISDDESIPPAIPLPAVAAPKHDAFWSSLFLICLGSLFATFFLVFLHTSPPSRKRPLGDTIYTVLHSSFHLLAVDTLIAVIVSLIWLSLLRSFVRPLVYLILVAAPVILVSFAFYPFASSYKGSSDGGGLQDRAMRWLSLVPAIVAALWVLSVYKARHALHKAIGILEFGSRILGSNPALLMLGFGTLAAVVIWTWIWMAMFSRVFLGGHISTSRHLFIIDPGSWWLGVYFVLTYLWTLSVGSGIQRAATAATVSQWYFHRLTLPNPPSHQVVLAALSHATTTQFGTICLFSLLSLLVRLPLLVLPRRVLVFVGLFSYSLMPTSVAAATNPLTLTYSAIHSHALFSSASHLSQMTFLSASSPVTALHPRVFSTASRSKNSAPLLPYRLAKLLLHATRLIMALALGFGGWVSTARTLVLEGGSASHGIRGSLYAYVVGLIAGAIGWGVLGAMEGVLSGVVDAAVVCWASEGRHGGSGGYCLEANTLFGDGE